jgi:hypothetical protein
VSLPGRWARGAVRFTQISWRERLLLAEAALLLALSSLAIAWLPFRTVTRLAGRDGPRADADPALAERRVAEIRWAVAACGRFAPWRPVCFQHGLAAHWMLRRRHIASTLFYGASSDPERGIIAHVWIKSGELPVMGCEEAGRYAVLATYPPAAENR